MMEAEEFLVLQARASNTLLQAQKARPEKVVAKGRLQFIFSIILFFRFHFFRLYFLCIYLFSFFVSLARKRCVYIKTKRERIKEYRIWFEMQRGLWHQARLCTKECFNFQPNQMRKSFFSFFTSFGLFFVFVFLF